MKQIIKIDVFKKTKQIVERLIRFLDRKFSRREQVGLAAAAAVIFLFILIKLIFTPVVNKKDRMKESLSAKETELKEMIALKTEYDAFKKSSELSERNFLNRDSGFTLFSFLDNLAGSAGVKENISYMKPTTTKKPGSERKKSTVEMKLQDITLNQLTTYLHGIETSKNMIFVKRLSISKKGKQDGFITVVLQAETFES